LPSKKRQNTRKGAQERPPKGRFDALLGNSLRTFALILVNFAVAFTLQVANFAVFVSKNRNLSSEHLRGK
jgi:hypothetical protein